MLNLLEKHKDIIKSFRIECYDQEGDSYRRRLEIVFINDSMLFFKEYLFSNGERKYAFNWMDAAGKLLCRWDNAPHWPDVITFPYHKHAQGQVLASKETTLEEILIIIAKELTP
jgi:hypothetical protein